jgi:CMP-N,N'-diacetyllegionaminic acid synthase
MAVRNASGDSVLMLIPARGGSKGIPRKNLQKVDGVSLVGRAVLHARRFVRDESVANARIVVDTDDPEIAEEGRRWGAEVPFLRPAELAADTTTTLASTLHLLARLSADGWTTQHVILLQPTSPLRHASDIVECWRAYQRSSCASAVSVTSASKPPQLAMHATDDGYLDWLGAKPPANVRRQDLAPAVHVNGAVYIVSAQTLRQEQAFVVPGRSVGVAVSDTAAIDIDTPADLAVARRLAVLGDSTQHVVPILVARDVEPCWVTLDGARLPLRDARNLVDETAASAAEDALVLRPARDGAGPGIWREATGRRVGVLLDGVESFWPAALACAAADFVVLAREADAEFVAAALDALRSQLRPSGQPH